MAARCRSFRLVGAFVLAIVYPQVASAQQPGPFCEDGPTSNCIIKSSIKVVEGANPPVTPSSNITAILNPPANGVYTLLFQNTANNSTDSNELVSSSPAGLTTSSVVTLTFKMESGAIDPKYAVSTGVISVWSVNVDVAPHEVTITASPSKTSWVKGTQDDPTATCKPDNCPNQANVDYQALLLAAFDPMRLPNAPTGFDDFASKFNKGSTSTGAQYFSPFPSFDAATKAINFFIGAPKFTAFDGPDAGTDPDQVPNKSFVRVFVPEAVVTDPTLWNVAGGSQALQDANTPNDGNSLAKVTVGGADAPSFSIVSVKDANGNSLGASVRVGEVVGKEITFSVPEIRLGPANTVPTITAIANQSTNEDTATSAIAFTVGDAETAAGSLIVSGASSNTTLVPNASIVFGGSGANRTVTVTPAANLSGSATITVTVSDGTLTASSAFTLTVNAVNDTPTITAIANQSTNEDTATGALAATIGDVETAAASLTLSGTSSNTTLVPNASITFGGSGASRTVTVTPAADQSGSATITVTVSDGTLTATSAFTLTVTAVNDPPALSAISAQTKGVNTAVGPLAFTVSDVDTSASSLTVSGSSSDTTLVPVANITFGGSDGSRTVTVTPAANRGGTATITITVSDGSLTASTSFEVTITIPTLSLTPSTMNFGVVNNGGTLQFATPQTLTLNQNGAGAVTWTAAASESWVSLSTTSGSGAGVLLVSINNTGAVLPATGTRTATVTITATGASNNPQASVALNILAPAQSTLPSGKMETPTEGQSGVAGSLPITGWAIDDTGVSRVRILRDPVAGEGASRIFIGDAIFVRGARPDIATAYPNAPRNDQAGWGYLLLTNFLPNQGNGTFTLHAYADDAEGNTTLIGSRTITCANAASTAPFGTIDTPPQGGTASGAGYVNFGWALAGQPTGRSIPIDGSTIQVFIDSALIGTVDSYNNPRSDIQALFPGYANTNGAIGVKTLNTTTLANGVHTIAWVVTDNLGAAAGIGSRFFSVSNSSVVASSVALTTDAGAAIVDVRTAILGSASELESIDRSFAIIGVRHGYGDHAATEFPEPHGTGLHDVHVSALDRVAIDLNPDRDDRATYRGYAIDGETLRALPVGSHLDGRTGEFAWAPPLGFGGSYDFVFVKTTAGAADEAIHIRVTVR